jgi:hypothetical protein
MKLPHFVHYTDKVKQGDARLFYVRINPKFKDDKGLHAHEYEHVKQWYFSLLIFIPLWLVLNHFQPTIASFFLPLIPVGSLIIYKIIPAARYKMEARAFRAQLKEENYDNKSFQLAATALANNYGLKITKAEAMSKLKERRNV